MLKKVKRRLYKDGTQVMWSAFCKRYERVSWCENVWGVEYEELPEMHDE